MRIFLENLPKQIIPFQQNLLEFFLARNQRLSVYFSQHIMAESLHSNLDQVREKYMNIAKNEGVDRAVSLIHLEMGSLEPKVFDDGYEVSRLDYLQSLRDLSRELWTMRFKIGG